MSKISIIILSLFISTAHAGFLKKAIIAGGATYAGHAIAKKAIENKEAKTTKPVENKVQPANKEIPR
jgi:hypothetical protein